MQGAAAHRRQLPHQMPFGKWTELGDHVYIKSSREEKGTTEDEMVGWHHWLNGHGFGWTPGVGDGQGGLASCASWGLKESDMTEWLNWAELPSPTSDLSFPSQHHFKSVRLCSFTLYICFCRLSAIKIAAASSTPGPLASEQCLAPRQHSVGKHQMNESKTFLHDPMRKFSTPGEDCL